jgi:hypothetical protein
VVDFVCQSKAPLCVVVSEHVFHFLFGYHQLVSIVLDVAQFKNIILDRSNELISSCAWLGNR